MGTSIRSEIGLAVRDRLATIRTANGYPVDIAKVYYDSIPLGLELGPEDLPALFVLDDGQAHRHLHGSLEIAWSLRLQLLDADTASDERMNLIIRNVAKALWSNSPTAQVMDQFRTIHQRIYQLESIGDETDLHMIEANRVATVRVVVHYRTKPYDL
jgi:hypothetical protein